MRVIVLGGCGEMGSEATRDLARTSDFEEIVVADLNLPKARALVEELGGGRVRAESVDASDEQSLCERLRGFNVVANCTTYHFGLTAARAAIRARVNYLDLGGLFNTPRPLELVEVPAFSGAKRVRFAEPVGEVEVYYVPHSETHTLPRFLGKGVRVVDVRGTWGPEIMRALRVFADFRLTGDRAVSLDGREISSKAFLRRHILQHAADVGGAGEWAFLLNVEVSGRRGGRTRRFEYTSSHPARAEWGTP